MFGAIKVPEDDKIALFIRQQVIAHLKNPGVGLKLLIELFFEPAPEHALSMILLWVRIDSVWHYITFMKAK